MTIWALWLGGTQLFRRTISWGAIMTIVSSWGVKINRNLSWWTSRARFLLVSEPVVYLVNSFFPQVGSVNSFCVVIRNVSDFGGFGYGVSFLVDEVHELESLSISYLNVLSDHLKYCWVNWLESEFVLRIVYYYTLDSPFKYQSFGILRVIHIFLTLK